VATDIIDRLRADFGQRTLGQLLQERDAAANEIERLRAELKALREVKFSSIQENGAVRAEPALSYQSGSLISAADVCKLLRISRSAFYVRRGQNGFPKPIQLGLRTVRYEVDAIIAWRKALGGKTW
jgi:predicted DNA-binding transcriptional regulator AlpA